MDDLEKLKEVYKKREKIKKDFTPIKERWYSWNYWAQHKQKQFSYDSWMEENNLKYKDVSGCKFFYPNCDARDDQTEGYLYYEAWRGGQFAIDNIQLLFEHLLQMCWEEIDLEGNPKYSKQEIGHAIGKSSEQFRKYISKKSWYKPRKKVSRRTKKGIQ